MWQRRRLRLNARQLRWHGRRRRKRPSAKRQKRRRPRQSTRRPRRRPHDRRPTRRRRRRKRRRPRRRAAAVHGVLWQLRRWGRELFRGGWQVCPLARVSIRRGLVCELQQGRVHGQSARPASRTVQPSGHRLRRAFVLFTFAENSKTRARCRQGRQVSRASRHSA